ncbi:MAG TPA: hypothetical protein VF407_24115 [Polyangiaceae bacterium]
MAFVVGHEVLFAQALLPVCDVCGEEISIAELESDESNASRGAYLQARGDEVRFDEAPLCSKCSTALGMTALNQQIIEEEEG